jgi:hypothetical protein
MPFDLPNPRKSLVVILGASSFPKAPSFAEGVAFYNSANRVQSYLTSGDGLGIDRANVLQLFDDSRTPGSQLEDIAGFLCARQGSQAAVDSPENLFVYYVGHGLFTTDRKYCLAVRCTNESNTGISTIRGHDLAEVIRDNAIQLRRFLILDCCFAASIYGDFLSAPGEAATTQLLEDLPERGTTLLCASSQQDVALAPRNLECTMFSDALLKALKTGSPTLGPRISLCELGVVVKHILKRDYSSSWVRPEIHSPDMRQGDIATLPLFPNPGWSPGVDSKFVGSGEAPTPDEVAAMRDATDESAQPSSREVPKEPTKSRAERKDEHRVPARVSEGIGEGPSSVNQKREIRTRRQLLEELSELDRQLVVAASEGAQECRAKLDGEREIMRSLLIANESYVKNKLFEQLGDIYVAGAFPGGTRVSEEDIRELIRFRRRLTARMRRALQDNSLWSVALESPVKASLSIAILAVVIKISYAVSQGFVGRYFSIPFSYFLLRVLPTFLPLLFISLIVLFCSRFWRVKRWQRQGDALRRRIETV